MDNGYRNAFQAYAAATQTVPRTRQIVMLYDGVIRNLQQATDAICEKRIEDRFHLLTKASDIITGMQSSLDFEQGGEVAPVLYNFYTSIDMRLYSLHHQPDVTLCEQLIHELKQMRDAWDEIDRASQGQILPGAPTSPEAPPAISDGSVAISA